MSKASDSPSTNPSIPDSPANTSDHRLEFTGKGREYFGIWIVNLLLMLVTLGLYYPWAKVRKLKYFYGNTWLGAHALDFHGSPGKMLRGMLLAGFFLGLYSKASEMQGLPALASALALVAVAPALFHASMRFRLANTSWRGMRFEFTGALPQAYWSVGLLLFFAVLPLTLLRQVSPERLRGDVMNSSLGWLMLLLYGVLLVAFPYLLWRIKAYQHENYALGSLRTEFRCGPRDFYVITFKLLGGFVTGAAVLVGVVMLLAALNPAGPKPAGPGQMAFWLVWAPLLFALVYLFFYVAAMSYWKVAMQNKVWSRTGNDHMRFVSRLKFKRYLRLQFRNYLFIVITLGLYWPFAVMASRRMLIESMVVRTRGLSLNELSARVLSGQEVAVGDAAADLFGMDVGM